MPNRKLTGGRQLAVSLKIWFISQVEQIRESSLFWYEPQSSQSICKALPRSCTPEENSVLWSWHKQSNFKNKERLFKLLTKKEKKKKKLPNTIYCTVLWFVPISHHIHVQHYLTSQEWILVLSQTSCEREGSTGNGNAFPVRLLRMAKELPNAIKLSCHCQRVSPWHQDTATKPITQINKKCGEV